MDLVEYAIPARVVKTGNSGQFELPAGRHLRIETSPDGEEVLNFVDAAPANVRVIVEIIQ